MAAADSYPEFVHPQDLRPAFAEGNVPIFFGCDDNFLPHAVTAMTSILANSRPDCNYDLIIVTKEMPSDRMKIAETFVNGRANASLRFLGLKEKLSGLGEECFSVSSSFSIATYFRLFSPGLFVNYEKILYLDSDLIVMGDISELYDVDLDGCLLAAARDFNTGNYCRQDPENPHAAFLRDKLNLASGDDYFNAGVLIFNLAEMRRAGTGRELLSAVKEISGPPLADQDILNHVCRGKVKFLDGAWNCMDFMSARSPNFIFAEPDIRNSVCGHWRNLRVLHYAGAKLCKPWRYYYPGENRECYWRYALQTPFGQSGWQEMLRERSFGRTYGGLLKNAFQALRWSFSYLFGAARKKVKNAGRMCASWRMVRMLARLAVLGMRKIHVQ